MQKTISVFPRLFLGLIIGLLLSGVCHGQRDTEFPKGFIFYARLHSGMVTQFDGSPDLFAGGLQLSPQLSVVPHLLRLGINAGGFFTENRIQGDIGPMASFKIKTFYLGLKGTTVGSAGNLHLRLDHLWGTGRQRLIGGGVVADFGNLLTFGLTAHRDYRLNSWWFQTEMGIRISAKKKIPEI